jgi:hypothetical protein
VATIHQSDLSSWIRCPTAFMYTRQGAARRQLSATAYGSVVHHALESFERLRHSPDVSFAQAVEAAVATFEHYWHPMNIDAICAPVDVWLPRQGYADLRHRGIENIRAYCQMVKFDEATLLATEFGFQVPIEGTWDEELEEPHILAGTIDKLALRKYQAKPYVSVEDYKTGKESTFLRQNLQFTAYCYATTRPEFWSGWRGEDGFGVVGSNLYERFTTFARRGTWINLRTVKAQDAGWRGATDYTRFALAVEQLIASWKADIYPMSMSGETCQYCDFAPICAGVGIADADHGKP